MDTNLEKAYAEVKLLVDGFKENERHYLSNEYQEAEARIDFINKFFIALGWDVNHDEQKDPYRQEVKVEKTQSNQKRPDYSFFLTPNYKDPIFFIEAKKPAKNLKDKNFYFQTIKYGWNAGTPLAVLTDFEEFHILDCRYKPNINYVLNGSHQYYHYSQYADKEIFAKIYYLFSREAVADNSIERYAKELKKPSGKAVQRGLFKENIKPIDDDFLEFIDGTRETLARAFKKNDTRLDSEELTEAVQRTIDRLVFIRFLEDKLIEQENYISEFGESGAIWKDFIAVCRKLDAKYNGVVFKKHFIDDQDFSGPELKGFSQICGDISHLNSPYDFNVIPIHILGSIYERFLGKVVHATDKRVTVEEKPEVRKAGGVYYTPKYIVDYIVKNTVGELIKGKTPAEISKLRIADIACGSGSFLIGAFECLLDYHNSYYRDHPEKAVKDGCIEKDGRMILSIRQKQRILLNNIYGVDIDAQAVEVTQLSLALKMLEDETTATANDMQVLFHEKIIPNLGGNIVCGNSLIGTDILSGNLFSGEEERKLNPMDFESAFPGVFKDGGDTHGGVSPERAMDGKSARGFDCVIGNPPYVLIGSDKNIEHNYYTKYYRLTSYKTNTYILFIEKALKIIKNVDGLLGFIIPKSLVFNTYFVNTRRILLSEYSIQKLIEIKEKVFVNAEVGDSLLFFVKTGINCINNILEYYQVNTVFPVFEIIKVYRNKQQDLLNNNEMKFYRSELMVKAKIFLLRDLCSVSNGLNPGNVRNILFTKNKLNEFHKELLLGKDINRYNIIWSGVWVNYDSNLKSTIKLSETKSKIGMTAQNKVDFALRNPAIFTAPKIIVRKTSDYLIAGYDEYGYYIDSLSYSIQLKNNDAYSLFYILGILNSKLMNYLHENISQNKDKVFAKVLGINLEKLPIKAIDFTNASEKAQHDKMVALVEQMLSARKELHHAKTGKDKDYYERRCRELDSQIDRLVYELYGLTEEEIRIVEGVHE